VGHSRENGKAAESAGQAMYAHTIYTEFECMPASKGWINPYEYRKATVDPRFKPGLLTFGHRENSDVLLWVKNVLKNRTTYLS